MLIMTKCDKSAQQGLWIVCVEEITIAKSWNGRRFDEQSPVRSSSKSLNNPNSAKKCALLARTCNLVSLFDPLTFVYVIITSHKHV
jgi:hypothetical protein